MNNGAKQFYDNFVDKLLNDYLKGNKRIEEAILFSLQNIENYGRNILDIGCGIGWSSHEFFRNNKDSSVHGIDLSYNLIKTADKLFSNPNLSFQVLNITKDKFQFAKKFNVIVMLDVYEHIQKKSRGKFHESLKEILEENFKLILTCPTVFHQNFLRKNKPDGLQPVDEDISIKEVLNIADDLNANVSSFNYRSIWHRHDYFHAVIERGSHFDSLAKIIKTEKFKLEKFPSRKKRIKNLE